MDIDVILARMKEGRQPTAVLAYTALHWQCGCRISDLLKVNHASISPSLNISILQGKGSQALSLQPLHFREFWKRVKELELSPMEYYDRYYFYRVYKRFGVSISNGKGKNNLVTHAFRRNLAQDIYTIDNNALRVQGALGHRSKSSTEFYIDKDKESS